MIAPSRKGVQVGHPHLRPQSTRFMQRRQAITLLELLVVLVLLALVATMTTIRFAAPLRKQRVLAAMQQWQSIDFLARKASRSADVSIRIELQDGQMLVSVSQNERVIRSWTVSSPMSMSVEDLSGRSLDSIRYVRAQGSMDYRVVLNEGATHHKIEVAGGTGKVRE
jgi:Tfp pilus assembly protein FimT